MAAGGDSYAYFVGSTASFSNDLLLYHPVLSGALLNNHTSTPGDSVLLGNFAPGTELSFAIFVHNTGETFISGPGGRNPDGLVHARVSNWIANALVPVNGLYVEFEDLFGLPEGASGYNDLGFVFTNVVTPEPGTGLIAAGALLAGIGFRLRTRARRNTLRG